MAGEDPFGARREAYEAFATGSEGRLREEEAFSRLRPHLPRRGMALDAGAGPGTLAARLAEAGLEVVALDFSAPMLESARARLDGRRFSLLRGDLASLPVKTGSFEVVCCHATLEYLSDPQRALAGLGAVVTRGGLFSVETLLAGAPGDGEPDRVFGFKRRGLGAQASAETLSDCGFDLALWAIRERRLHLLGRRCRS